jgi:3-oxoacyl-[acyl-carrier-protein] synthase-3
MAELIPVGIAGTGSYLPETVIPNSWFEDKVETSDEWIVQRTGIKERRFVKEGQATSHMCIAAGKRALEMAGLAPEDLDLVIVGTLTPDYYLPACAALVQNGLGAKNAAAFDISAACTGFLTALQSAEAFIASGRMKRVLVLGAESLSRYLDLTDRTSCILFGDGAGAAILTSLEEAGQGQVLKTSLGCDGSGYESIHMVAGGALNPATHDTVERREHFIRIKGREVYRFAVSKMSQLIEEMLEGQDLEDLTLVVPHQVNQRIIDAAIERIDVPVEKVMINIDRYANTSAATVPIALDEALREGRIEKGKLVVLVAFGAGMTWGASLLRW